MLAPVRCMLGSTLCRLVASCLFWLERRVGLIWSPPIFAEDSGGYEVDGQRRELGDAWNVWMAGRPLKPSIFQRS